MTRDDDECIAREPSALEERLPQLLAVRRENDEQLRKLQADAEANGYHAMATLIAAYLRA